MRIIPVVLVLTSCNHRETGLTTSLQIGIAEVNYTPPVGLDLVGNYRGNDYASRGVHDSLYARALVVENEDKVKVAFLTVDICKLPKESIQMMRSYIASQTGIDSDNILIHATHTHSGPKSEPDASNAIEYLIKAASAVVHASENMKPGKLSVGRVHEYNVAFNRRLKGKDGKVHMSWERIDPAAISETLGSADPELNAVLIQQNGITTGALINFGCHATTLTGNNWLYSADYPGMLANMLKGSLGENFIPLFFNGCCGNVTQIDYRRGFIDTYQECERIGNLLGVSSLQAFEKANEIRGNRIVVSKEMVALKRMTITENQYAWAKEIMAKVEKEGMPPLQPDGIPDAQFAKQWIEMYQIQNRSDSLEVMVVSIGDLAFVGMPGEIFSEIGMDIKARSSFKNTIVMGLTNDNGKYFPDKKSFSQGPKGFTPMISGYETTPGAALYDIGAAEKMAESALNQLMTAKQLVNDPKTNDP